MPGDRKLLDALTWRTRALADEAEPEGTGLVKQFTTEVKQPDTEDRLLEFVITTDAVDRDGDIIEPDGWEVDNFLANPVVLWAHSHWDPPVARAVEITRTSSGLTALAQFPTREELDVGPNEPFFPGTVYNLLRQGYLSATSVGFMPLEWTFDEERGGVNFLKQELLEFSVVPVPANPEALIAASGSDGVAPEHLKSWARETIARLEAAEDHVERGLGGLDLEVTLDSEKLMDAFTVRVPGTDDGTDNTGAVEIEGNSVEEPEEEKQDDEDTDETEERDGPDGPAHAILQRVFELYVDGEIQADDLEGLNVVDLVSGLGELEQRLDDGELDESKLVGSVVRSLLGALERAETDEPAEGDPVELLLSLVEDIEPKEPDPIDELLSASGPEMRAAIKSELDTVVARHVTAVTGRLD